MQKYFFYVRLMGHVSATSHLIGSNVGTRHYTIDSAAIETMQALRDETNQWSNICGVALAVLRTEQLMNIGRKANWGRCGNPFSSD